MATRDTPEDRLRDIAGILGLDAEDIDFEQRMGHDPWWYVVAQVRELARDRDRCERRHDHPSRRPSGDLHLSGADRLWRAHPRGDGSGWVTVADEWGNRDTIHVDAIAAMRLRIALRAITEGGLPVTVGDVDGT